MNKQQLAAKIWESANQMRSKIEANEYKDYILGFIFYKYLSDKQIQFAKKEEFSDDDIKNLSEEDADTTKHFQDNSGILLLTKICFLHGLTWARILMSLMSVMPQRLADSLALTTKNCLMAYLTRHKLV
jgi:type I restriction-modification system DNA methylase subunit